MFLEAGATETSVVPQLLSGYTKVADAKKAIRQRAQEPENQAQSSHSESG